MQREVPVDMWCRKVPLHVVCAAHNYPVVPSPRDRDEQRTTVRTLMLMLARSTSLLIKLGADLVQQLRQTPTGLRARRHASMRVVHVATASEGDGRVSLLLLLSCAGQRLCCAALVRAGAVPRPEKAGCSSRRDCLPGEISAGRGRQPVVMVCIYCDYHGLRSNGWRVSVVYWAAQHVRLLRRL